MNSQKLPFVLKGAGIQEKQCHINRSSGLPYNQLIFSFKGRGLVFVEDREIEVEADQVIFLKSDEPHHYQGREGDWKTGWIIFTGAYIDETLIALGFNKSGIYQTTPTINRLYKEILSLKSQDMNSGLLSCKIYEILVMLIQPTNYEKVPSSIQVILDIIQKRYAEPLTLDTMSNVINVTPQYLCKHFKDIVSVTPIECLKLRRLEVAKDLLLNTQLSVKDIAASVGYSDNSYFGSLFKKHVGVTAKAYRGY